MVNIERIDYNNLDSKSLNIIEKERVISSFQKKGIVEFDNLPWEKNEIQDFTNYFTEKYSSDAVRRSKKYEKTNINSVDAGSTKIPLHSEASFSYAYPEIIWFYCYENDEKGSPTTICDGAELWKNLEKSTKEFFLKNPITYTVAIDIPYKIKRKGQEKFFIEYPGVSDSLIDWELGKIMFNYSKFVINIDRKFDKIWFANHLLVGKDNEEQIKKITTNNNNSIPEDIMKEINIKSDELTYDYVWKKNRLLMLNNYKFMHGRRNFDSSSNREILNLQSLKTNF